MDNALTQSDAAPAAEAAPAVEQQIVAAAAPDAAATLEVLSVSVEPAKDPADRALAADYITRFVGTPEMVARGQIEECDDDECRDIIAAGGDRHTARPQIIDILNRAYDRRREASAKEAIALQSSARRSGQALAKLQSLGPMSADDSAKIAAKLKPAELDQLAEAETAQQLAEILAAAEARAAAEAAKS
jgi:hypothetical protein